MFKPLISENINRQQRGQGKINGWQPEPEYAFGLRKPSPLPTGCHEDHAAKQANLFNDIREVYDRYHFSQQCPTIVICNYSLSDGQ